MQETKNLTQDEQMDYTLTLTKKVLFENGLCGRLVTYAKHAERLLTENADTTKKEAYDLLDQLRDLVKRYISGRLKKADEIYFYDKLKAYFQANPTPYALAKQSQS